MLLACMFYNSTANLRFAQSHIWSLRKTGHTGVFCNLDNIKKVLNDI